MLAGPPKMPTTEDFERWVALFRGPLIGLCAGWVPDWNRAEELAQDSLAQAWLGRERFRGDPQDSAAVGAWLRGIAFHLHSESTRRPRAQTHGELAIPAPELAPVDERQEHLRAAFAELSSAHQTVLRMHYLEDSALREVAALLGLTPKAVESRLYQARKALRERVEQRARAAAQELRR